MKPINFGGGKLGIDMMAEETEMPKNTVRDAVNVDITAGGGYRRRRGFTPLASFTGAHSIWSPRSQAYALFAHVDTVRMITPSGAELSAKTLIGGLRPTGQMSYCEHGQDVYFTNGAETGVITGDTAYVVGVSDPAGAPAIDIAPGGLFAGRYGCAYSYLNSRGDESGMSPAAFITLDEVGGVLFDMPSTPDDAVTVRLYMTPVNGEVLYHMADVPAGLMSVTIGDNRPGKVADTQYLSRMPGGSIVRVYRGRLMVARGSALIFSEPFNHGLTSRRHNFIQFKGNVTMLETVEGGVYVGTPTAVYFLEGGGPGEFKQTVVSLNAPVPGCSTLADAAGMPEDLNLRGDAPVALWLGRVGYSIGTEMGEVHDVQAERIDLPEYEGGSVATYTKNGITQVISVVQSDQSSGAGSAVDDPN